MSTRLLWIGCRYASCVSYSVTRADTEMFDIQDWAMTTPYFHDLYDMDADPDQLENLFGTQPALEKELHDELLAYWSCQGADCP